MLCSFKIFPFYLISVFLFYINACKLRQLVCTPTLTDSIFGLFSVFILHFHLPFSLVQSLSFILFIGGDNFVAHLVCGLFVWYLRLSLKGLFIYTHFTLFLSSPL